MNEYEVEKHGTTRERESEREIKRSYYEEKKNNMKRERESE
jgi:hypothetical protein